MVVLDEKWRRALAIGGVFLWLAYPFMLLALSSARWEQRCGHRKFAGTFDECFNDALPVLEVFPFFVTLALAYLVGRFAFSIFAPLPHFRKARWRLASTRAAQSYHPIFPIYAALGVGWAAMHLSYTPLNASTWYLQLFWAAWMAWFITGVIASWPPRKDARDG